MPTPAFIPETEEPRTDPGPGPLGALKAKLDALRAARGGAPAPALSGLAQKLQQLRQASQLGSMQGEAPALAPVAADVTATRPAPPVAGPPPILSAVDPATQRARAEGDVVNAGGVTAGKIRAVVPGAAPASFVERAAGGALAHLPGAIGRYGENLRSLGEEHGAEEQVGREHLPFLASLPADVGNLWLEIEGLGRIPGPVGAAIREGYAQPVMGSLRTGELAAPGLAASAGRVLRMAGREGLRFGTLEATKATLEGSPPEEVVARGLAAAGVNPDDPKAILAGGLAWGAGSQLAREGIARLVGAAIRGRAGAPPPAYGTTLPPGPPEPGPESPLAPAGRLPPAPSAEAPNASPEAPSSVPPAPKVDLEHFQQEMEAGQYNERDLKMLRARFVAGPLMDPATHAEAMRVVDAIDKHLTGQRIAAAAPFGGEEPVGPEAMPGEALHDAEGNVIPGTEVTPELRQAAADLRDRVNRRILDTAPPAGTPERRAPELPPTPRATPGIIPEPARIVQMPTSAITADPARFQFKSLGEEGVGTELKGVKKWNPNLGGVISVWHDPADGKTYVVNGHHRLDLAKRLGVPAVNVQYLKAPNATSARAQGAFINIAEGRGTATDVGKFLRDTGNTPEQLADEGISLRGDLAKSGVALSRLAPDVFDRVATAKVPEGWGAAIGRELPDQPELQRTTLGLAERSRQRLSAAEVGELAKQVRAAGSEGVTQNTLFGQEQGAEALYVPRAQLTAALQKHLAADKRLFSYVSKQGRPEELARAGSTQIDTAAARDLAQESGRLEEVFNRLATRTGPVADVLKDGARRIAHGERPGDVARSLYPAVRSAVEQELGGKPGAPVASGTPGTQPGAGGESPVSPTGGSLADALEREGAAGPAPVATSTDKSQSALFEHRKVIADAAKQIADAVTQALHPTTPPEPAPGASLRYADLKPDTPEAARESATTTFGSVAEAKRAARVVLRSAGAAAQTDLFDQRPEPLDAKAREAAVARAELPKAWVPIKGQAPKSYAELHGMLWPFRSPQMERMHYLLIDPAGQIVEHQMHTSGAINYVQMADSFVADMVADMKRVGATEAIISHNHPSGVPKPSPDDIAFTAHVGRGLERAGLKLRGQYVIDDITGTFVRHEGDHYSLHEVRLPGLGTADDWTATHGLRADESGRIQAADLATVFLAASGALPDHRADVLYFNTQAIAVALEPHTVDALSQASDWLPKRMQALAADFAIVVVGGSDEAFGHALRRVRGIEGVWDVFQVRQAKDDAHPRWIAASAVGLYTPGPARSRGAGPGVSARRIFERPTGPGTGVPAERGQPGGKVAEGGPRWLPSQGQGYGVDLRMESTKDLTGLLRLLDDALAGETEPEVLHRLGADRAALQAEIASRGKPATVLPITKATYRGRVSEPSEGGAGLPARRRPPRASAIDVRNAGADLYGRELRKYYGLFRDQPDGLWHAVQVAKRMRAGETLDEALEHEGVTKPAGLEPVMLRLAQLDVGLHEASIAAGLYTREEHEQFRAKELAREAEELRRGRVSETNAYHGTPHRFDRFEQSKIGTGQGAQSYGYGHYFAEVQGTARTYREQLAPQPDIKLWKVGGLPVLAFGGPQGSEYIDYSPPRLPQTRDESVDAVTARATIIEHLLAQEADFRDKANDDDALRALASRIVGSDVADWKESWPEAVPEGERILKAIKRDGVTLNLSDRPGAVYNVKLNVDPHEWLDWEKPVADQQEAARRALNVLIRQEEDGLEDVVRLGSNTPEPDDHDYTAGQVYQLLGRLLDGGDAEVSEKLRALGVKGVRYLDQFSRVSGGSTKYVENYGTKQEADARAAQLRIDDPSVEVVVARVGKNFRVEGITKAGGTHNYVVFDEKDIGKPTRVEERGPRHYASRAAGEQVHPEDEHIRAIARGLKTAQPAAVAEAAAEMAPRVPDDALLVPVPTSLGDTGPNRALAEAIASRKAGTEVRDVLGRRGAVSSQMALRQRGLAAGSAAEQGATMRAAQALPPGRPVALIDNIEVSGATLDGARQALGRPDAVGVTYAEAALPLKETRAMRVAEASKKYDPTSGQHDLAPSKEGPLKQAERQARARIARLRDEFPLVKSQEERARIAGEISQLEKLVNRGGKISPEELATQAAALEEKPPAADPEQTALFEQGPKYQPGNLPVKQKGVVDDFNKLLDPASRGPDAKAAARQLRKAIGEYRRTLAVARARLEAAAKIAPSLDTPEGRAFYDRAETGVGQMDPKLEDVVKAIHDLYKPLVQGIQDLGTGKLVDPIENYMAHLWADPAEAQRVMAGLASKRPLRGKAGFLKQRTIPTLGEGMDAGLKPVTDNPVELNLLKMREMAKYLLGQHFLAAGKDEGWAEFHPAGQQGPAGWSRIDDPTFAVWGRGEDGELIMRGNYWMPEAAAQVVKNYLSPGLRGNAIYDAYMGLGNTLNQFQLGASGFHAGFSTMTAVVSRTALNIGNLRRLKAPLMRPTKAGALGGFAGALAGGVLMGAPGATLGAWTGATAARFLADGLALKRAYLTPGSGSLVEQRMAELLSRAGGQVMMDPTYKYDALKALKLAAKNGNIPAGIAHAVGLALQTLAWPTMEFYVPLIKLGAFSHMMQAELAAMKPEAGELFPTDAQVEDAAQGIWHSVDNRFGQVSYDTRFWNNAIKQTLMGVVRAVGWDAGSVDELVGGLKEGLSGKPNRRFDFLVALVVTTAMINILTQLALAGEGPRDVQDLFEPRDGTFDPDGNANRLSPATYMKDVLAFGRHPITTLTHKLHPVLAFLHGLLISNQDFYGDQIRNPGDPLGEQLRQVGTYIKNEFEPLSMRNVAEASRRGTSGPRAVLPMVGWSPAPREAERTKAQNMMSTFLSQGAPQARTPEEVTQAQLRADVEQKFRKQEMGYSDAREALRAGGLNADQIRGALAHMTANPLVERFKQLPLAEARQVYDAGTEKEKDLWGPALFRKEAEAHPRNPPRPPRAPSPR